MVEECLRILHTGEMLVKLNDTNIVLVPKKDNPETMGVPHPIALCNVLYKIVAKTLANGLKSVLHSVVFETQSAFLRGHLITNNILIASEVLHFLKKRVKGNME